ncbi:hypothetical protein D3C80_1968270 [compost metagenome]
MTTPHPFADAEVLLVDHIPPDESTAGAVLGFHPDIEQRSIREHRVDATIGQIHCSVIHGLVLLDLGLFIVLFEIV